MILVNMRARATFSRPKAIAEDGGVHAGNLMKDDLVFETFWHGRLTLIDTMVPFESDLRVAAVVPYAPPQHLPRQPGPPPQPQESGASSMCVSPCLCLP